MEQLIKRCKCGIYLDINIHKDLYQKTEEAIKKINENENEIDEDMAKRMIKEDMIISLQFYPNTPVGFYKIYGTSYDEVIKQALEVIDNL